MRLISGNLDYETMPEHILYITALDGGPDHIADHTTVTINLMDVNDHTPETTINILSDSGQVEVHEEMDEGKTAFGDCVTTVQIESS